MNLDKYSDRITLENKLDKIFSFILKSIFISIQMSSLLQLKTLWALLTFTKIQKNLN